MDQEANQNQDSAPESLEAPEILEQPAQTAPAAEPLQQAVPAQPDSSPSPSPDTVQPAPPSPEPGGNPDPKPPKQGPISRLLKKVTFINIYLLIFLLLIVVAGLITFVAYQKSQQSSSDNTASSQSISADVLKQLKNTDVTVGQPKQILSVEANAVFTGTVLVRGDFEAAGQIKSEGSISTSSINVSGSGTFQTVQANKLVLSGDGQIQGNLAVQNSLSVSGSGNFGGTLSASKLSIQSLDLSGDLNISKHLVASGGTPSKSNGSALGGGGTSSISGSDTAGTITINTGSSPHTGCFISVGFAQKFGSPHVVVTPIGSGGAGIDYYVSRSSGSFSLCSASTPPSGKSFSFDYIVID